MTPPPGPGLFPRPSPSLDADAAALAGLDPHRLAAQELLRPPTPAPAHRDAHRELPPFGRAWFEELESKRYAPPGAWLRRALEFTRHAGDKLVMLGPGAGTDAVQYHRHGTDVTVCVTPSDRPALVRQNFAVRNLPIPVVAADTPTALPFAAGEFDLAYLNLMHAPPADLGATAADVYRVLKPGGKVFVLAPARFDAGYWQRVILPLRHFYRPPAKLTSAPRYSVRALKAVFPHFTEPRTVKRHLRRSELPHIWRFPPVWLTERLLGRMLVLRAFKPVSAAWIDPPADEREAA